MDTYILDTLRRHYNECVELEKHLNSIGRIDLARYERGAYMRINMIIQEFEEKEKKDNEGY